MITTDPIPSRYLPTRLHVVPDAMPTEWINRMGLWLHAHRADLRQSEADKGERWHWEMPGLDESCEHLPALRSCIVRHMKAAAEALQVEPAEFVFDLSGHLMHHGNGDAWAAVDLDRRGLCFELFLHSLPKQFTGGEVEFQDGALVEPNRGTLAFWPSECMRRVRRVECYSALAAHGRWSIAGCVW